RAGATGGGRTSAPARWPAGQPADAPALPPPDPPASPGPARRSSLSPHQCDRMASEPAGTGMLTLAAVGRSSVRVTGWQPEARGADGGPDHPAQTREHSLVTSNQDRAICNRILTLSWLIPSRKPRRVTS